MSDFFEGTMAARDYLANKNAVFHPAVNASDNNGAYAPPCLEIGGVQVYAYVRDGILVVSLDYDTADVSDQSPFALYGGHHGPGSERIPTVITAGHGKPVWDALPSARPDWADGA
jgi:hypothetical protein